MIDPLMTLKSSIVCNFRSDKDKLVSFKHLIKGVFKINKY